MGNKENVLEILKKHKDGLILVDIDTEYEIEHGRKLRHTLYRYLSRLVDMGLVEQFKPEIRTGKILGFRATERVWEREALEILKKMIKPFAENKITVMLEDSEKDIIEDLWGKIDNE